jgi:hypothetical protein
MPQHLLHMRAFVGNPGDMLNSPPAIVVGTLICRTAGELSGGSSPPRVRMLSIPRPSRHHWQDTAAPLWRRR